MARPAEFATRTFYWKPNLVGRGVARIGASLPVLSFLLQVLAKHADEIVAIQRENAATQEDLEALKAFQELPRARATRFFSLPSHAARQKVGLLALQSALQVVEHELRELLPASTIEAERVRLVEAVIVAAEWRSLFLAIAAVARRDSGSERGEADAAVLRSVKWVALAEQVIALVPTETRPHLAGLIPPIPPDQLRQMLEALSAGLACRLAVEQERVVILIDALSLVPERIWETDARALQVLEKRRSNLVGWTLLVDWVHELLQAKIEPTSLRAEWRDHCAALEKARSNG
jgi:hypothetical protein